ncbi:Kelch repeat-containing protein [Trichoderma lentiforme]|uniref:Kelch repeat-containing protein n=1 Tax=Trichoderma lentiforme TaxID=1567552 RepID=A0A9P4XHY6_9HYPO|nr:Kelch repeat-containing protein [Trichoderma lentiforme]
MAPNHTMRAALLALLLRPIQAQFSGWADNQINTTICYWGEPRAALIRNKIFIDGGNLVWLPGLKDGSTGFPVLEANVQGYMLSYNLSYAFTPDTNVTNLLLQQNISKALGGQGVNGETSNYVDGALLANDDEFFFYGGLPLQNTIQYADPTAHGLYVYQAYQYGAKKPLFDPGLHRLDNLPNSVSQFVTYGGAANAPSENLAWYFSGQTSQSGKSIYRNYNATTRPSKITNSLITVDMTTQGVETWSNKSTTAKGRASPALVWVPVGAKGILVALGGVVFPYYDIATARSDNATASKSQSPTFMRVIDVYDVASGKWYTQPTADGPSARARGCAVVATASDSSSYNIYYYGGTEGLDPTKPFYDDVWVLSLPSFTWTQITDGKDSHARSGHQCFTPYPDQMMVIGGETASVNDTVACLEDGPIIMFNLTSGEWMDSYDPTVYGEYGVPDKVQAVIGGKASGGATATQPAVSGWATPDLGKVFATTYDQKKISTYWPYPAAQTSNPPAESPQPPTPPSKSKGLPSWVGPVLGVILGLIALTCIIVLFCLWRRRKNLKNRSSTNTSEEAGRRILSWIRGQPPNHKAPTETTTEDTPGSPGMQEYIYPSFTPSNSTSVPPQVHEVADTQLVELDDTTRVELQDTGLSPMDIRARYSHWFQGRSDDGLPSPTRSSLRSTSLRSTSQRNTISPVKDRNSVISQPAGLSDSPSPPVPESSENDEKSLLPTPEPVATPAAEDKQPSDESARTSEGHEFVVSPPTAEENPGDDYLTVKKSSSNSPTTRKSVFQEHHED